MSSHPFCGDCVIFYLLYESIVTLQSRYRETSIKLFRFLIRYQVIVSEAEADSEEENNTNGINHKKTAVGTYV